MPQVKFRAKVETVRHVDNSIAYRCVRVPALKRSHCDMQAFRTDRNWGSYANSDLFLNMLNGAKKRAGVGDVIKLDAVPSAATVDESGFLAVVTIDLPNWR